MPWIRIDDHFDEHPKLARVSPVGWGIWLAGLAYCNRNLTDGFIPRAVAHSLGHFEVVDERGELIQFIMSSGMAVGDLDAGWIASLLVSAGLWEEVPGGYKIHDYDEYQPSKEKVLAEREAAAARQGRHRSRSRNGVSNAVTDAVTHAGSNGVTGEGATGPITAFAGETECHAVSHAVTDGHVTPAPVPVPKPTTRKRTTSSSRRAPVGADLTPANEDDARLCRLLAEQALQRNPKFKVKSRDRWLTSMRLLRERDGNTPAEIERSIRWVFADDFWGGVIQSPANLRSHFAAVWDQMNRRGAQVIRLGSHLPEGQRPTVEHQAQVAAFAAARAADIDEDELAAFRAAMEGEPA